MSERPAAPQKQASHTLLSIQILRGVAALGVLTHHTFVETTIRLGGEAVWNNAVVGAAGVDLFFVISGFVMVYASEPLFGRPHAARIFILRRLARIVPLYWAVTGVILGYIVVRYGGLLMDLYPPATIVTSLLFYPYPRPDGVIAPIHGLGWTLNYEMFFYAVFAAAILLARRAAIIAISAAFIALVTIRQLYALPLPFSFWFDPIILEFCLGMLIADAYGRGVRLPRKLSWWLALAALTAFAASAAFGPNVPWRVLEWGVPSAALVAALVLSRETAQPSPIGRAARLLGDASYSLYLVHPLVMMIARQTILRWMDFTAFPWVLGLMIFFGSIAAAIASYLLFEKPIMRALGRRINRKSARSLEG